VLAERGEVDMAFEWLDRAYHQRDGGMLKLSSNPLIRNLKNDARLQMILRSSTSWVPPRLEDNVVRLVLHHTGCTTSIIFL